MSSERQSGGGGEWREKGKMEKERRDKGTERVAKSHAACTQFHPYKAHPLPTNQIKIEKVQVVLTASFATSFWFLCLLLDILHFF